MDTIKTFNFNQSYYGYTGSRHSFDLIFKNEKVYYAYRRNGEHEDYIGPETELNVGKIPEIIKTQLIPMLSASTSSGMYTNNHPGPSSSEDGSVLNYILYDLSRYVSQLETMIIETNNAVNRQQDLIKKQYISIYLLSTHSKADIEPYGLTSEPCEREIAAIRAQLNSETEQRETSEREIAEIRAQLNSETEQRKTCEREIAAIRAQLNSETEQRKKSEREMEVIKSQMTRDISLGFWEMI